MVILASKLKANVDISFTHRFNSFVEFENRGLEECFTLRKNNLPQKVKLDWRIDLKELVKNNEITGANTVNRIQGIGFKTLEKKSTKFAFKTS